MKEKIKNEAREWFCIYFEKRRLNKKAYSVKVSRLIFSSQLFFLLCFPSFSGLVVDNLESQDFNVRQYILLLSAMEIFTSMLVSSKHSSYKKLILIWRHKHKHKCEYSRMHLLDLNPFQEISDPAPDIWVWGIEPGLGYLPHVRRRPRLFWNKFCAQLLFHFLSLASKIGQNWATWHSRDKTPKKGAHTFLNWHGWERFLK